MYKNFLVKWKSLFLSWMEIYELCQSVKDVIISVEIYHEWKSSWDRMGTIHIVPFLFEAI